MEDWDGDEERLLTNIFLSSLVQSFERYMDGHVQSHHQVLQLAKVLSTAIKPPGFMQTTRAGIEQRQVWDLHRRGILYALQKISGCSMGEDRKKAKAIQFFDVLHHLPFAILAISEEVVSM